MITDAAHEAALLNDIRTRAHHIRDLRASDARLNGAEIKSLEQQAKTSWDELRRFRAGPDVVESLPDKTLSLPIAQPLMPAVERPRHLASSSRSVAS